MIISIISDLFGIGILCRKLTIGTNILDCKSEVEWADVAIIQCSLHNKQAINTSLKVTNNIS